MSKQTPPAPTASAIGPCPTISKLVGRPGTESLPSTFAPPDHAENKGHNPLSQSICNYCKQSGHIGSDCPVLKRKRDKQEGLRPTGRTSLELTPQACVKNQTPVQAKVPETDSVMEIYKPFLSDGYVSLNSDFAQSTSITILRDTGASKSLILADSLPFRRRLLLEQVFLFRV